MFRFLVIFALLVAAIRAQESANKASDVVIRTGAQEVLLDFVARDKHNKLVTDLRPDEVQVFEDGVKQTPRSFQFRTGKQVFASRANERAPAMAVKPVYDPLREINLVSIVLERMSYDNRARATQAVRDFLRSGVLPNTYIGVFTLNHRLAVLQPWTTDLALLNRAVDRAATGNYLEFAKGSEQIARQFNSLQAANGASNNGEPGQQSANPGTSPQAMNRPDTFQPINPGSAEERGPDTGSGAAIRQVILRDLQATLKMMFQQEGYRSIDALRALIHAQAHLPGRKTVLYLSDGLVVPPEQPELLEGVVGEANRSNITFYTVDTRGLSTARSAVVAADNLALLNLSPLTAGPAVQQTNLQLNLRQLAEATGGFAMDNSNDLRAPLERAMEEVGSHYEITYSPTSTKFDGHFREIAVKVSRPGLKIEARRGYFALPLLNGEPMAPFEMAALGAINASPAPRAFDYHVAALRFDRSPEAVNYRVVFSVPSRSLRFTEQTAARRFRLRVSVLALVKDDQDQVVGKATRDLPYVAPLDKEAAFREGEVTIALPLRLQPGRYHLDTAVLDREADAASVRRSVLVVPAAAAGGSGPDLSDIVFISGVQANDNRDPANPLEFSGGRVSPVLEPVFRKSSGNDAMFYVIVYPRAGAATAAPDVQVTILREGQTIAVVHPSLPAADEVSGAIPVVSRISLAQLDPGAYEVDVTASQGGASARSASVMRVE